MTPVEVVIVHRDQPEHLAATVDAFGRQDGVDVTITVVDNGSPAAPSVGGVARVIPAGGNLGFGPAANLALRRWLNDGNGGEWAVVAPHDALPAGDCLARVLAAVAGRPRAGLACADVGDLSTPRLDPYLGAVPGHAVAWRQGWEAADYPHGTLMVARRACLEEVGLFDERYFAYGEEADLGARARRSGWECGLVRGAMVANAGLGSPVATVEYLQLRNTLLFVRDHSGRYHAGVRFVIGLGQLVAGVLRRRPASEFSAAGRLRALVDYARGRFGAPPPPISEIALNLAGRTARFNARTGRG